jgi:RHS repeat-associated protein
LKKSYSYADGQILAQKDHENPANVHKTYWYVHDRLGSVRQVLDYHALTTVLEIAHSYGYTPFGQLDAGLCYDDAGEPDNPFRFTGQWYDAEIGQYYLRARMYDPQLMRFTSRDPVAGRFGEPITLHRYLYCANDPANNVDLNGKTFAIIAAKMFIGAVVGALCSGANSDWDARAMAVGFACGMISGALPDNMIGGIMGMMLSSYASGYAEYRQHGRKEAAMYGAFVGAAGGGIAGLASFYFQASSGSPLVSFVAGQIAGVMADQYYSLPLDPTMNAIGLIEDLNKQEEEAYKQIENN